MERIARNGAGKERLGVLMTDGTGIGEQTQRELAKGLHDLCQPLTTLQCRLEIALMDPTAGEMEQAITDGLAECTKLNAAIRKMQEQVHHSNDARSEVKS